MGCIANLKTRFHGTSVSAHTQLVFVSLIAFCCPGIFNALNGLGGAGSDDPTVANNANTALYACFAVFGVFGGLFFNTFGNKILMGAGGFTYAFYAICQYVAGVNPEYGWLAVFSGAVLGVGAGLFWTAQGAMMIAYATPEKKGTYVSTFWVIFNCGGLFGGLLTFIINFNNQNVGKANPASYFFFAGMMTLGSISAFFLLCDPKEVVREDGKPVQFALKKSTPLEETKSILRMFLNRDMLLLTPLFVGSNWFYTHQFNAVNGGLFTVRTRGLNSAIYRLSQMFGSLMFGRFFLDRTSMSRRRRGILGVVIMSVYFTTTYCLGLYLQLYYRGGYDKNLSKDPACKGKIYNPHEDTCRPRLDVSDGSEYIFPLVEFLLYGMNDAMLQTFAYWLMGCLTDECEESARITGYYKGVQSAGAAIAWSIDNTLAHNGSSWMIQLIICWVLFEISLPTSAAVVVTRLPTRAQEENATDIGLGMGMELSAVSMETSDDLQISYPADEAKKSKGNFMYA